jgi:hypothetical protein
MRVLRAVAAVVVLFAVAIVPAQTASAEDFMVIGGDITVRSVVLPTHTITIDQRGRIMEIASNTAVATDNIKVYQEVFNQKSEVPLADSILQQYRLLLPTDSHVGILYQRGTSSGILPAASVYQPVHVSFLPAYQPHTILAYL